jgi:hypothetical protein
MLDQFFITCEEVDSGRPSAWLTRSVIRRERPVRTTNMEAPRVATVACPTKPDMVSLLDKHHRTSDQTSGGEANTQTSEGRTTAQEARFLKRLDRLAGK